ncbi:MAG: COX15/CtaA family protein [Acidimicrobiales bacterium]|nr:COX15/CtaA family protein [Acidimicrobiales bacterium]
MTAQTPTDRDDRRAISPETYRRICGLALILLAGIVVTGAAVRLTGSGLGCSDWPTCEQDRFVPEADFHGWVEFGNRLITGLVSVAVIAAVLGSLARQPRRSDLVRWSWGLVAGVIGQVILGGIVVLSHLNPWLVLGHFALSMVLVWNAVVLHHRAGDHTRSISVIVPKPVRYLTTLLTGVVMVVLGTGTLVTGTGPHAGSRDDPIARLPFTIQAVARIHGTTVIVVLLVVTALVVTVRKSFPTDNETGLPLHRAVWWLVAIVAAQAAIGWSQYFTGVPVVLVGLHVAGATALWIVVVKLRLLATCRSHGIDQ